ncbi:MAG: aldo/keto reductase [Limnochordia bacterium]|jgi:aryl-alcohol dehydrogenase-like predicted oxidoreductase
MRYKVLGTTGVKVSALCMGTMSFGGIADEQESKKMFHRCRDLGINFFDTACNYNQGRSEEILGRLIKDCRQEVIISTKVYHATFKDVNAKGLARRSIMREVEASLRRLGTDWIDFYFVHNFDPDVDMEDVLRAFDDLQRQGKILYPAVSNWAAWQIAKALGVSEREGLAAFRCIQPMYNLVKRQVEVEILPLARSEKLGVIPYSPLGGGLLTGKYLEPGVKGRLVDDPRYQARYGSETYYEIAARFVEYARAKGIHPATLAVAWVMSHPDVTAPLVGARSLEQLEPSLDALNVDMTPEWRAEITALSIDPPPATDRSEGADFQ